MKKHKYKNEEIYVFPEMREMMNEVKINDS